MIELAVWIISLVVLAYAAFFGSLFVLWVFCSICGWLAEDE